MKDTMSQDYISGRQWYILAALSMVLLAAVITTAIVLGFREAGNNRVKDQREFMSCIASGQTALECRVAIRGTNN
jgi:hypothetical protein